jgi:HEAT repeat protein
MNMLPLFGQDAREALPQLVTALSDPDTDVRTTAAEALKQIAPEVLTNSAAR